MVEAPSHDLADPLARRNPADTAGRCVDLLWFVWLTVLPLGHITGLHNTLAVVTVVSTLFITRARKLADVPALPWLVGLIVLAGFSLLWSGAPDVSAGKMRSDLVLPLAGFIAAFLWVRERGARSIFLGYTTGILLLALSSLIDLAPERYASTWFFMTAPDPFGHRFVDWYPGVGDASAAAVMAAAPLLAWRMIAGHLRDAWSSLLALALVFIIVISENRNAVIALPLTAAAFALFWNLRPSARGRVFTPRVVVWIIALAAVAIVAGAFTIERMSQMRLADMHMPVPFGQATSSLLALDLRPRMWHEFLRLGQTHPWLGAGFGRTVPALSYDTLHDPVLVAIHANRLQHAHNFILNWWLQLGGVGVVLLLGALAACAWRGVMALKGTPLSALAGAAALTLLFSTVARNFTDDFLVYGMAANFWIGMGALLGLARYAGAWQPPLRPLAGDR